jgi:hypothetical protein
VPFPAPPVLAGNRETAVRHLAECIVYPACKKHRRREPATFALFGLFPVLSKPTPPLALPAVCISVFHSFSPSYSLKLQLPSILPERLLRPAATAKLFNVSGYNISYEGVPLRGKLDARRSKFNARFLIFDSRYFFNYRGWASTTRSGQPPMLGHYVLGQIELWNVNSTFVPDFVATCPGYNILSPQNIRLVLLHRILKSSIFLIHFYLPISLPLPILTQSAAKLYSSTYYFLNLAGGA